MEALEDGHVVKCVSLVRTATFVVVCTANMAERAEALLVGSLFVPGLVGTILVIASPSLLLRVLGCLSLVLLWFVHMKDNIALSLLAVQDIS